MAAVMAGLPGAYDRYDIPGLRAALERWTGADRDSLRTALARFLAEVVPAAEDLGVWLCVHPDDRSRDLLGLPRIVSCGEDIAWLLGQADSHTNGAPARSAQAQQVTNVSRIRRPAVSAGDPGQS